jgi:integrase
MIRIAREEWIVRPPADVAPTPSSSGPIGSPSATDKLLWSDELKNAIQDEMDWKLVRSNLRRLAESDLIPALARRLADFAERTFSIRTMFDKRRSARTMRKRLQLLADAIVSVQGESDIADLPTETLEDLYRKAIQNYRDKAKKPREINALIRAFRELHTYLCALHGKRPLSDDRLLVALPVLDRTDANILTIEEYYRLLLMIDLERPTNEPFDRRNIARLLVILGYRAGLRREEARLLRVSDVVLDGRMELWIRPSLGHTLKSDNSLRRVEVWKLLEDLELDELRRWIVGRDASGDDFLFKTGSLEVVPQSIFDTVNDMIARITGNSGRDGSGHFHHCRHSLASLGFMRLMIGDHGRIPDLIRRLDRTSDWLTNGEKFRIDQLYRNSFPKRKHAFLLARLLGHGHPATTVRYIHIFGILLHHFLRRAPLLQPGPDLQALARGRSHRDFLTTPDGTEVISAAVEILCKRDGFLMAEPAISKSKPSADFLLKSGNEWISELPRFLRYCQASGLALEEVASRFGLDIHTAKQILERARRVATLETDNGVLRHRVREFEPELAAVNGLAFRTLPRHPVQKYDLEVVNEFAPRVNDLASNRNGREVLLSGVDAYVHSVWSSRSYPVFSYGHRDGRDARAFLDLLRRFEIELKMIRFISFDPKSPSDWPNIWRKALGFSGGIKIEKRVQPIFRPG